jgi:NAD(P)-dependent dehydrogenase (short-subunit alcohol dehydrogenase family)
VRLEHRRALVTGAGRGIGEAIALAFAREGCRLALAARTAKEIESVAGRVRASGGEAHPIVADVSAPDEARKLVDAARAALGGLDILVNNAGVYGPIGAFAETDPDAWWKALEVNLRGTALCTRAILPPLLAAGGGSIINLSGGGATSPLPNLSAYAVSKAAVVRFTETLAEELKPHQIRVNAIAPGAVDTRLQDSLLAAGERAGHDLYGRIREMRETGRGGVPPTLAAELAVFLASDAAAGLTGKLISAPHDPWREWHGRGEELSASPMYTLRRLDPFTLRPLRDQV